MRAWVEALGFRLSAISDFWGGFGWEVRGQGSGV